MADELPSPTTTTELYLAAILKELRAQGRRATRPQSVRGAGVELREPKEK